MSGRPLIGRYRQPYRKAATLTDFAVDGQATIVANEYVLDDGKAETGAAQGAGAGRVDSVKALGQARQMGTVDAPALVGDSDGNRLWGLWMRRAGRAVAASGDGYVGILAGIFDRVSD